MTKEYKTLELPDAKTCGEMMKAVFSDPEVQPDTALYDALASRLEEVHAVGDCTGLGLIRKAVEQGARAACAL